VDKGWADLEGKEVSYDDWRPSGADLMWGTCDAFGLATAKVEILTDKIAKLSAHERDPAACVAALKSRPEGPTLQAGSDVRAGSAICFFTEESSLAIVTYKKVSRRDNLTISYRLWWDPSG
jgi:hypothetical protein